MALVVPLAGIAVPCGMLIATCTLGGCLAALPGAVACGAAEGRAGLPPALLLVCLLFTCMQDMLGRCCLREGSVRWGGSWWGCCSIVSHLCLCLDREAVP